MYQFLRINEEMGSEKNAVEEVDNTEKKAEGVSDADVSMEIAEDRSSSISLFKSLSSISLDISIPSSSFSLLVSSLISKSSFSGSSSNLKKK
jgi:glycerol-3-phosphate dehydrogenase